MTTQTTLVKLQGQIFNEARATGKPVRQLLTWLLDRRNLEAAWDRVSNADGAGSPGIDGVTCVEIQRHCGEWLGRLADDLFHGRYQPAPPRWIDVPKHPGATATRRLGILTVRDRVVHAGLKQVLEPVLEPGFHAGSFGFRPGRSVPGALAEAGRLLTADTSAALPFHYAVHLDVADCFDTVDHRLLLEELGRHVADDGLARLLGGLLRAGGKAVRRWWRTRLVGLVQGSALSPLLCNLYLHALDEGLAALGLSTQGGVQALRYADDLLLLARDARLARQGVACVRQTLGRLRQRLRQPRAEPRPAGEGVDWLGVRLRLRPNPWTGKVRFGYVVPDDKVRQMLARLEEMTALPSSRIAAGAFNLGRWVVSVNDQLRDWREAYVFADNATEVFRTLDEHTRQRIGLLLNGVTGTRFRDLYPLYRVWLPRGFWTWQVDGVRLVVLSSLAPRCPRRLTQKPAWQCLSPKKPQETAPVRQAGVYTQSPFVKQPGQGAPPANGPAPDESITTSPGEG